MAIYKDELNAIQLSSDEPLVAGQCDVLPAERSNLGEQLVRNADSLSAEPQDSQVKVNGVPLNDCRGQQAQSQRPKALVFESAVAELALAVEEHSASKCIVSLALVQPSMASLPQRKIGQRLQSEQGMLDALI
jgi:hypothetical protein